jgi:hypothetical protein
MSHVTFSRRRRHWRQHTFPRHAIATSATVNDTSKNSHATSYLWGSTRHPTSTKKRMKNMPLWHCPQKTCRRGIQVPSTCHYLDIMLDHVLCDVTKKRGGNWHVLTCLSRVFLLSDMTNFRWRPGGELCCQNERTLPFFLTSQKTWVSYSALLDPHDVKFEPHYHFISKNKIQAIRHLE